ncbi:glycerol-3-phosphate ABC transporter ATP-binding protein [Ectothiorhodospira haloalkaliphila]|uniref:Glycerol-3-phosphate ABC transporter ATP-binding protein n=1 Tax=Ectothiorhodospira haloalkaliphila TaxID=421628 RepID=W8KRK0_9GAMM|nr:ATP-binding cassette domain-containing protein [Ectothiorhodospira haloalkaliphila]AHK78181.1 glycerol-3-phosphate ABC transporter ATP-binding protein [Ectothiorhodospira haloalkaliphila]
MAVVEFADIHKAFAGQTVIRDLDLHVAEGEWMVLLGPSGCGKSTLLRLLAGLEAVEQGEIRLDGRVVNDLTPQQRNVAMVFQDYALYPNMTVRENLAFPLRMRGMKRARREARIQSVARTLGLEPLLGRRPAALSGGQRQRVAMGRALVRDPAVFLMDEPLSNLDARLRGQIRNEIATLRDRLVTTTLYVTHDQVEAMTLGQRVAVMAGGILQQVDTPMTLYDQPANLFVARFLGSPPMNCFAVRLRGESGRREWELAGQWLPLPIDPPEGATHAGLRPEAFSGPADARHALQVVVEGVEALGHEVLVYFTDEQSLEGMPMAARLPGQVRVAPGDTLTLLPDAEQLHWFDASGRRLATLTHPICAFSSPPDQGFSSDSFWKSTHQVHHCPWK